jgi:hypothetical protein
MQCDYLMSRYCLVVKKTTLISNSFACDAHVEWQELGRRRDRVSGGTQAVFHLLRALPNVVRGFGWIAYRPHQCGN